MSWHLPSRDMSEVAARSRRFCFQSTGRTDCGQVRTLNEDAFLESPDAALWAVADGMGGHSGGDVASALVTRRLGRIARHATAYALRREVAQQLRQANEELLTLSQSSARGNMGATVAVLTACDGYYSCTWAGDSRIYLLRRGRFRRITTDHSLVQSLIDAGEITPEEARRHPQAHVVTRAIGASSKLSLETANGELEAGDRFLLCSDGLTSVLEDKQILSLIADVDKETAVDRLISNTLNDGAPDNVTVIIIDVASQGA